MKLLKSSTEEEIKLHDGEEINSSDLENAFDEEKVIDGFYKKEKKKSVTEKESFPEFADFANMLNVSVAELKEDCCLYQIRKIMSRLGKVVVRYNVTDSELEKILNASDVLKLHETLIAPVHIDAFYKKAKKRKLLDLKVNAIIDFPFGESMNKGKVAGIKECLSGGVDGVCVMMSSHSLTAKKVKEFRKELKKISKITKGKGGIAVSAMELDETQIKFLLKAIEKTKIAYLTLVFGEATETDLREIMAIVNKYRGKITVKVLGNVDSTFAVTELFKLNADYILTPYADRIGEDMVKKFKVKSIKL